MLTEGLLGSLALVKQVALIVFPLMLILEILKELKVMNRLGTYFEALLKPLGLSREAALPLITGTCFGLSYGAGVIIQSAREGRMTKAELYLLNVFLSINHAIFEDTLLFMAIGANGLLIFGTRFLVAILLTMAVCHLVPGLFLPAAVRYHSRSEAVEPDQFDHL